MDRRFVGTGLATLALAATVAGCSHDTTPTSPTATDRAAVASSFNRLGDSVMAAGGTTDDAAPYFGAAALLGFSTDIATITVRIDGVDTPMHAVATAVEIAGGPMIACPLPATGSGTAAPYVCPWGIPHLTRTLFAWLPSKPASIVTLVASVDSGPIATPAPMPMMGGGMGFGVGARVDSAIGIAAALLRPIPAHLEYADGRGNFWWGSSGTQKSTVKPSGTPCAAPPTTGTGAPRPGIMPSGSCQLAQFSFAFDGAVGVPPIPMRRNGATGTHAISLATTTLQGSYLKLGLLSVGPHP